MFRLLVGGRWAGQGNSGSRKRAKPGTQLDGSAHGPSPPRNLGSGSRRPATAAETSGDVRPRADISADLFSFGGTRCRLVGRIERRGSAPLMQSVGRESLLHSVLISLRNAGYASG